MLVSNWGSFLSCVRFFKKMFMHSLILEIQLHFEWKTYRKFVCVSFWKKCITEQIWSQEYHLDIIHSQIVVTYLIWIRYISIAASVITTMRNICHKRKGSFLRKVCFVNFFLFNILARTQAVLFLRRPRNMEYGCKKLKKNHGNFKESQSIWLLLWNFPMWIPLNLLIEECKCFLLFLN